MTPPSAETVAGMVERLRRAVSAPLTMGIAATMLEALAASLALAEGELQAAKRPKLIDQNGKEVGWERRDEPGREDVWRDENDTIWQRPTAWAYFAVCRARDAKAVQAAELQERVRVLEDALRPFGKLADRFAAAIESDPRWSLETLGRRYRTKHFEPTWGDLEDARTALHDTGQSVGAGEGEGV